MPPRFLGARLPRFAQPRLLANDDLLCRLIYKEISTQLAQMPWYHFRLDDQSISEWLEEKKNKSDVCREAITKKYQDDMQKIFEAANPKKKTPRIVIE